MKKIGLSIVTVSALIIAACSSSKKYTASAEPAKTTPATAETTVAPVKSTNGIYAPGNEELIAIQAKYKDVTMETLAEGHSLYTVTCTKCHGARSIYSRAEEKWPDIIESMAPKSKLTEIQKDALLKYVLAIKATQPKK